MWPAPFMHKINHLNEFIPSEEGDDSYVEVPLGPENIVIYSDGTYRVVLDIEVGNQLFVDYGPKAFDICVKDRDSDSLNSALVKSKSCH